MPLFVGPAVAIVLVVRKDATKAAARPDRCNLIGTVVRPWPDHVVTRPVYAAGTESGGLGGSGRSPSVK